MYFWKERHIYNIYIILDFSHLITSENTHFYINFPLHRPERKMRQNAIMICISYNYVSSNLDMKNVRSIDEIYINYPPFVN